jgi:hypothetical protein
MSLHGWHVMCGDVVIALQGWLEDETPAMTRN